MSEAPAEIDGVRCYAPALARAGSDYPLEAFERLFAVEARNFWFRARNRILLRQFGRFLDPAREERVLELGCGTGFVLGGLAARFPRWRLMGAELHVEGLRFARRRLPAVEFAQVDARDLPFRGEFSAVGAFDVLEHIEEDEAVMRSVLGALAPGGRFFVSMPQHPFLWSAKDDHARHKRRYTRAELRGKLERAGFRVRWMSSFVTALFPLMLLSRRGGRRSLAALDEKEALEQGMRELELPRPLDLAFELGMRVDEALIALGASLPFGGSIAAVAERPR